jgi:hypothetical protein
MTEAADIRRETERRRAFENAKRLSAIAQTTIPFRSGPITEPQTDERETAVAARLRSEQARARAAVGAQAAIKNLKRGDLRAAAREITAVAAETGGQLVTAQLLKLMWLKIYWVLPLFYINFHFLARYLGGSRFFCKFGEEWFGGNRLATEIGAGGEAGGQIMNALFEILEIVAMFLSNLIVAMLVFMILVIIYYLIHPCEIINFLKVWPIIKAIARGTCEAVK